MHVGHISLLRRARELGGELYVGLSSDSFNSMKNKKSVLDYENRKSVLESLKFVDFVFPEEAWEQKQLDIKKYDIDTFVMGDDWEGEFDFLKEFCEVLYLSRTPNISTTMLKRKILQNAI